MVYEIWQSLITDVKRRMVQICLNNLVELELRGSKHYSEDMDKITGGYEGKGGETNHYCTFKFIFVNF